MELRRVAILDQIDRFTNDPLSKHSQDTRELKGTYNRIVTDIRNDISAAPCDILDIFPPEVWIQIVKDALPVRGYTFALLLLTMVSDKWMQALISVPSLWTHIELRGSREDSLATVEVFRQLSRDAPVYISIYVPTRHDRSTISGALMNIGPRICEVTIGPEPDGELPNEETLAVLQLLLTGSQFHSSLTCIHLEGRVNFYLSHGPTSEFIQNNPLPPSLRAIRGFNFEWRDFQKNPDYLERLQAIDSCFPMGRVLSDRIQLPNLKSLTVVGYYQKISKAEDEEGFPSLRNLTSLTYRCAYREALMRLVLCVAPQLFYLNLKVPHNKIPLLAAALLVAINLRTLRLIVESDQGEDDERGSERVACPVYQHITGKPHGLRDLDIYVVPDDKLTTPEQAARRSLFLSFLMSNISGIYTKVGILRLTLLTEPPIPFDVVLSYVQSLLELRKLRLEWLSGYFSDTQDTYTLEKLEYLHTSNIDVSHCFRTPNLLYLGFTWGCHRNLDTLTYPDLRKLCIDAPRSAVVELPGSSFPSLQELNVRFPLAHVDGIHRSFKLTSFPFLRSITLDSDRYQPQGTMLCFTLLSHPSTCPSLSEIKFHRCFPDWDILFLMLEKRNFMADSAVSLIRRITLPFIPSELCAPLASLLGGIYTERPPNNDLFMGGARELLLDEHVPGCTECLLRMKGGCKLSVVRDDGLHLNGRPGSITSVKFAWTEIPEYGDPTTLGWMIQRNSLLEEFILRLVIWRKQYRRAGTCLRVRTEMEISEDGAIAGDDSWNQ